jgi:hypothetical protein
MEEWLYSGDHCMGSVDDSAVITVHGLGRRFRRRGCRERGLGRCSHVLAHVAGRSCDDIRWFWLPDDVHEQVGLVIGRLQHDAVSLHHPVEYPGVRILSQHLVHDGWPPWLRG